MIRSEIKMEDAGNIGAQAASVEGEAINLSDTIIVVPVQVMACRISIAHEKWNTSHNRFPLKFVKVTAKKTLRHNLAEKMPPSVRASAGTFEILNPEDVKMNLNSSDTKEAKALETSATTIESYNLATTSNANRTLENYKDDDNSDDEEENDDGESKKEKRKAPIELMGEFLKAIMDRDYKLSCKLCQMILLYEPENPEAKQFEALLEMKIQLDEAASTSQNDGENSTESDSSDEDDSEDSNNEDSDEIEKSDEESIGSPESEDST